MSFASTISTPSRSLISMRESSRGPTDLRYIPVDKSYRHLRLCLKDGLADAVAAERRHERFAYEVETNLSPHYG